MWLLLDAMDVWLFRDGMPFTAGAERTARSVFPPTAFTAYGLLRSALLAERTRGGPVGGRLSREEVARHVGEPDDFGRYPVSGPFIARHVGETGGPGQDAFEVLLPAPADLLVDPEEGTISRRAPLAIGAGGGDDPFGVQPPQDPGGPAPLAPVWVGGAERLADKGANPPLFLPEREYARYLSGALPTPVGAADLYVTEERTGLQIGERTRTAEEGQLYSVSFVRPRDGVCLAVNVHDVRLERPSGLIPLGGEARAAAYRLVPEPARPLLEARERLRAETIRNGRIKVVLATPGIFSHGWLPGFVNPRTLEAELANGARLRLVSAAVPRAQRTGSFDMVSGRPRATWLAAPAGSVYWFEAAGRAEDAGRAFDQWHGHSISDQFAGIGFGLAHAGGWDYV